MKELWRNIEWYKGMYQISSFGRIRSFKYNLPRLLKPRINNWWYLYINLSREWRYKSISVHRLVASEFLWKSNLTVNHKNWNKLNNCVENLEWISGEDNYNHAKKNGMLAVWEKNWNSKLKIGDIKIIKYKYKNWKSMRFIAKEFWVSHYCISQIINNKSWN